MPVATQLDTGLVPASGSGTIRAFAMLWALVVLARTFLHTVVPLQAYALLGDAESVSLIYFLASLVGVAGSLSVPWLVRHMTRRHVFTLAAIGLLSAPALLASKMLSLFALGLVLQVVCVATVDITLNLYVMDHLPRRQFAHFEPLRAFYAAAAFTIGPLAGVWLARDIATWVPFALSAATTLTLLVTFWLLRWSEHPAVQPMRRRPPNPLIYLPHFFRQPRLRLAYLLASARSGWWSLFTIYAPIYVVQSGFDSIAAGAVVSAGLGWLFFARLWGVVSRIYGVRRFLIAVYAVGGAVAMSVALAAGTPWLGLILLLTAAFILSALEGVGNVYFLRAVRPLERPEMTTVFTTYRDAGQTVPPGICVVLLRAFDLPVVFLFGGLGLICVAWYARHIPRSL